MYIHMIYIAGFFLQAGLTQGQNAYDIHELSVGFSSKLSFIYFQKLVVMVISMISE